MRSRLALAMSSRIVVRGSAWRMAYCMSRMLMPATRPVVQNVRRNPCGLIGRVMPAA